MSCEFPKLAAKLPVSSWKRSNRSFFRSFTESKTGTKSKTKKPAPNPNPTPKQAPNPNPIPPAIPKPAPAGCPSISYKSNADNEYWVELQGPTAGSSVTVHCANGRSISCVEQWGGFTCNPNGLCTFPRTAIVGGRSCPIGGGAKAVSGTDQTYQGASDPSNLSAASIGIIIAGVLVAVIMIIIAVLPFVFGRKTVETA